MEDTKYLRLWTYVTGDQSVLRETVYRGGVDGGSDTTGSRKGDHNQVMTDGRVLVGEGSSCREGFFSSRRVLLVSLLATFIW